MTATPPPDLSRRATAVAPDLLGTVLRHGPVAVRLTEVEAYEGTDDPASHAWRGPTPRTRVMFGPPGHLYVYLSYGIHQCLNIVCGPDGVAAAVLLRAGEVVDGLDVARRRRPGIADHRLATGPGCLAKALGITPALNGAALGTEALELSGRTSAPPVSVGPRVGITRAAADPNRFWITADPSVSRGRAKPSTD